MTTKDQLNAVKGALQEWARGNAGTVHVASDAYHAMFLLVSSPAATRCVVLCAGETKRGVYEEAGLVDRKFWVVVSRGKGMKLEPGASLTEGVAGGKAMFDLQEEAREIIRRISFDPDTTEVTPDYKGWEPFPIEGYLTDAQKLEFWIGVQLPAVDETEPAVAPDVETAGA